MPEPKILQRYCEAALAVLNSQYDSTKVLEHRSTAGAAREQILIDFLQAHLPELVSVVSGQIFDATNNYSRQQDIVLVLKSMPRLPFASGSDLIYNEGVVATVEVKTQLDASTLRSVCQNIESVRRLDSGTVVMSSIGVAHKWPADRILTATVTYGGTRLQSHAKQLETLAAESRPDLLLDLSQGLLVQNHGFLLPKKQGAGYILDPSAARGFKAFLTFLTEITGTLASRTVNWRRYW